MPVHSDLSLLSSFQEPLHLAVGVFDGLHLGHQAVIRLAARAADQNGGQVVIVTFDPHPAKTLAPSKAPLLITSSDYKAHLADRLLGIHHLLAIRFDHAFAERSAEDFIRHLCSESQVASISVGQDFHFGKNRGGNVALLESMRAELGFVVHAAEMVSIEGTVASSTRIRNAIQTGDFSTAWKLLGRPFSVFGSVIPGRKLGRTIGFPTANMALDSELLPPKGVYAVTARGNGDSWNGVANLGFRPTVEGANAQLLLEVHLFGLTHEIYGEQLEVEFVQFLRGEQKFDNIEQLKAQIATDSVEAKTLFAQKLEM